MRLLPEGWVRTVLVLGAAAAVIGGLVVVSGVVSIKASAGHWPTTRWFLSFARDRSVATHSADIAVPALDDHRLVAQGAAHFERACRVCHGAPGRPRTATMAELTPEPPELATLVPDRDDEDLFYVVKHGVKMTGMPAWPARQRDDEVWAMVAFLRELPALDSAAYRRLAGGERAEPTAAAGTEPDEAQSGADGPPVPALVEARCARCHGRDGRGRDGAFPRLAGQKPAYLEMSVDAYAAGRRHSGIMQAAVSDADPGALAAAVGYFASLPPAAAAPPASSTASRASDEVIQRGERISRRGLPADKVPTCASCHGPEPSRERNEHYPDLAGQPAAYLANQLELFRSGNRGETTYAHVMELGAEGLEPEDIEAVAAYYSALEP